MTDETIDKQAVEITLGLPRLMRQFFKLDIESPAIELPAAQQRVCTILQEGPRTVTALSLELGISCSATTQIADRLVRAELVERLAEEDDRRVKTLQLAPHGVEMMRRRTDGRVRRATEVLRRLDPATRTKVLETLHLLLDVTRDENTDETTKLPLTA